MILSQVRDQWCGAMRLLRCWDHQGHSGLGGVSKLDPGALGGLMVPETEQDWAYANQDSLTSALISLAHVFSTYLHIQH